MKITWLRWVSILLLLVLIGCGSSDMQSPMPSVSEPVASQTIQPSPTLSPKKSPATPSLPAKSVCSTAGSAITPVRLKVTSVDVDVPVDAKPLNADGSLPVPVDDTGYDARWAATWVNASPRPGSAGVSDFTTHSFHEGDAPGNRLTNVKTGDEIQIYDSRGRRLCYTVTSASLDFSESKLPFDQLYDSTGGQRLAIIFCTHYSWATGTWRKRGVIFATQQ